MTLSPEVSERARALAEAVEAEFRMHTADVERCLIVGRGKTDTAKRTYRSLRAIVTELGITQEMVDRVKASAEDTRNANQGSVNQNYEAAVSVYDAADALSVLLAAGGTE